MIKTLAAVAMAGGFYAADALMIDAVDDAMIAVQTQQSAALAQIQCVREQRAACFEHDGRAQQ